MAIGRAADSTVLAIMSVKYSSSENLLTDESTIRACVPPLASLVSGFVEVAGALCSIRKDFIVSLPIVAHAPGSAAYGGRHPVGDTSSGLVEGGLSTAKRRFISFFDFIVTGVETNPAAAMRAIVRKEICMMKEM